MPASIGWLRLGGVVLWLGTLLALGVDVVQGVSPLLALNAPERLGWALGFVAFGGCYWGATDLRRPLEARAGWTALMGASALFVLALAPAATDVSLLLVLTAAVLPGVLGGRAALAGVAAQTLAMGALQATVLGAGDALINALYMGLVMGVMALLTNTVGQEREAKQALFRANVDLRVTRALLDEASREAERMRIARELHDTLGHHLTVLGLELQVARHQAAGDALDTLERAQQVNRRLLRDLRGAVSELRAPQPDLHTFVRELQSSVPGVRVRCALPERLPEVDPPVEGVLMRFMQECLTNSLRHAGAREVCFDVTSDPSGVGIVGQDNGRVAVPVVPGHGLRGLRERFVSVGGTLTWSVVRGTLCVRGHVPGHDAGRAARTPGLEVTP